MAASHIVGWSGQRHFLVVELDQHELKITPVSATPVTVRDKDGHTIALPIVVRKSEPAMCH